ncbi:MAG: hypothetical protein ACXWF8_09250 [Methylobacter sp.]
METLKLVQKAKTARFPKKCSIAVEDDLIGLFPLPRYFQVHFQHVHERSHDLQNELDQLKAYVAQVDEKLERVIALLTRSLEHGID